MIPFIFLYLVFIISPKLLKLIVGLVLRKGSLDLESAIVIKWKTAPNIAPPIYDKLNAVNEFQPSFW